MQKIAVNRPRLADLVYDQILDALQDGELKDRLHQGRIAEQLDVSRTPVREALLRLEREGVIIPAKNGGFELKDIKLDDVKKMYEARVAIEGYCAGQLAQSVDHKTIDKLVADVIKHEGSAPKSTCDYYVANRTIHRAFVEACGNDNLLRMFDEMWNRSQSIHIFGRMEHEQLCKTLLGHLDLCDAIKTGDFATAQSAMHAHIWDGLDLQVSALQG